MSVNVRGFAGIALRHRRGKERHGEMRSEDGGSVVHLAAQLRCGHLPHHTTVTQARCGAYCAYVHAGWSVVRGWVCSICTRLYDAPIAYSYCTYMYPTSHIHTPSG